jgi:hypothetical protein
MPRGKQVVNNDPMAKGAAGNQVAVEPDNDMSVDAANINLQRQSA